MRDGTLKAIFVVSSIRIGWGRFLMLPAGIESQRILRTGLQKGREWID